ncbi:pyridoxamine 5'-phosphate oxidase family protein [Herbidospora mongoliensis]|uniref:pyridoxamine 5'-phosphate oxidase family protein n=1 Tax=Herbidospora mongoliensis TaxID=688067 RepID=UPI0012FB2027|nr:pyridoxamine 5'-phosphate oxidase family protein [Herbidospora mongoliensis]
MRFDSAGMQVLSREQCLFLLAHSAIGRVVFTDQALPAVQPVTFCLDGEDIVMRTAPGSRLAAATRDNVVAFEADDFDAALSTGWSVSAIGRARAAAEPREITRLGRLPLKVWTPGGIGHFIVMTTDWLSGRRTSVPAL